MKAYITEWRKFFAQCDYLPTPFRQMETNNRSNSGVPARRNQEDGENIVRNVSMMDNYWSDGRIFFNQVFIFCIQLMLNTWNNSIFKDIKQRLQNCAMKLIYLERNGEAFDSQLVIGVRESYGIVYIIIYNYYPPPLELN